MGCGGSKVNPQGAVTTGAQKSLNKSIENRIQAQQTKEKQAVKILLLGAGECGKSTILKQMKILHSAGFTPEEKAHARNLVFRNTVDAIQSLIKACRELDPPIPIDDKANSARAAKLEAVDSSADISLDLAPDIHTLWQDPAIQQARRRENEFHMLDSAPYFLDSVMENFKEDFTPSQQDILRTRLTTTGILESKFQIDDSHFKMYDVGGQRGERKKWIHCFDDVTAIMFVASLSEYDQKLAEDRTRNRLVESLDLFEGIVNLPWFEKASIILFLNKKDLFEEKIKRVDIGDYHEDYNGQPNDYEAGLEFIKDEYFDRNENEYKTIYCHVTDATDTKNMVFVLKACQHTILESKLTDSGLQMC